MTRLTARELRDPTRLPSGSPEAYRAWAAHFRREAVIARRYVLGPTPEQFDAFDAWMERYAVQQEYLADLAEGRAS